MFLLIEEKIIIRETDIFDMVGSLHIVCVLTNSINLGSGEAQPNAPLAKPDSESFEDTEPMVEYKVVDQGTDKRPVVLQEMGKQPSKFFISETQKKAKVERQRNLLLMAVAYSANIGGMYDFQH